MSSFILWHQNPFAPLSSPPLHWQPFSNTTTTPNTTTTFQRQWTLNPKLNPKQALIWLPNFEHMDLLPPSTHFLFTLLLALPCAGIRSSLFQLSLCWMAVGPFLQPCLQAHNSWTVAHCSHLTHLAILHQPLFFFHIAILHWPYILTCNNQCNICPSHVTKPSILAKISLAPIGPFDLFLMSYLIKDNSTAEQFFRGKKGGKPILASLSYTI